jgi:hypothetical protein
MRISGAPLRNALAQIDEARSKSASRPTFGKTKP